MRLLLTVGFFILLTIFVAGLVLARHKLNQENNSSDS